jgi:3-hydroxy-9,10-secoandrosta-1,3,5(10)-triene-9,17-dione monooxygenase reductase component
MHKDALRGWTEAPNPQGHLSFALRFYGAVACGFELISARYAATPPFEESFRIVRKRCHGNLLKSYSRNESWCAGKESRGSHVTDHHFDTQSLRKALGSFATGVTIVTTLDQGGRDIGLTANSFNSVSLDPPMVLWSLSKSSLSLSAFKQAEYFAVHVLSADQEPLSNLFATRGADKFASIGVERGRGGIPLLPECAARFECRTAFAYEGGDHEIIVGEVLGFSDFKRAPLVFQGGNYALALKKPIGRSPATAETADFGAFTKDYLGNLLSVAHLQMRSRLRPALEARGFDEEDYAILSLLMISDHRKAIEVDGLLQIAGKRLHDAKANNLAQRDLIVERLDQKGSPILSLTPAGRHTVIELMAVAKAAEADTELGLDFVESQMLKHLLKRVIRNTAQGPLKIWPSPP